MTKKNINYKVKKYHVTKYNLISGLYFNLNYLIIANVCDFKNKKVLDFGGGLGYLKKKLVKKGARVKIYDIVEELSDIKDYKKIKFDIVIFSHVLMYVRENDIKKILTHFASFKKITIISCFSNQTIINKFFAFILGHPNPHEDTKTPPQKEEKLLKNFFRVEKSLNFFFFKVLVLKVRN